MLASDIYGAINGTARTQDTTQPTQSKEDIKSANQVAQGKSPTGYGLLAILMISGVIIGLKFAGEHSAKSK